MTMTPAEELRAAAERIREYAKGTTPADGDPAGWLGAVNEDTGHAFIFGGPTDEAGYRTGVVFEFRDETDCQNCVRPTAEDLRWMWLMSPELAEPLAAWLEDEARQYDLPPCNDPTGVCNRCEHDPSVLDALAVARAINGGTSSRTTSRPSPLRDRIADAILAATYPAEEWPDGPPGEGEMDAAREEADAALRALETSDVMADVDDALRYVIETSDHDTSRFRRAHRVLFPNTPKEMITND